MLTGDFNAKLGSVFVPGDVHDTSTNGKYLLDLWKTQDLCLLDTQNFTHGVFTRVNNKNRSERSVINYLFCTYDLCLTSLPFILMRWKSLPGGDN